SSLCFHDTPTPSTYALSLHDALPIYRRGSNRRWNTADEDRVKGRVVYEKEENSQENRWDEEHSAVGNEGENARNDSQDTSGSARSEEHTSELQSPCNLVCRLLLEKKK